MTILSPDGFTDIRYEVHDAVAKITINRPEKLNAFTPHTLREMIVAFKIAGEDPEVGVIVLTGEGVRAFSAGGDVNVENQTTFQGLGEDMPFDEINEDLYDAMRDCLKPVIARVNGYAIGGGHHMAYMCDLTIACDEAIFGQNGPRVASPAEGWMVAHLWTVVGMKRAKEIWLMCRRYSAKQAVEWGLANACVPRAELDAEVDKWCKELLALSPTVLKLLKLSFDTSIAPLRENADRLNLLSQVNREFFESGEQTEGASAFLEKRKPDFSRWR